MIITSKKPRGFTIIELLIVIVIIAILAAITLVAYSAVQGRAKNAQLQAVITEIQKKLELYNVDNGSYPATQSAVLASGSIGSMVYLDAGCNIASGTGMTRTAAWIPGLDMTLPQSDARIGSRGVRGCFMYQSDGTSYILSAWNMVQNGPQTNTFYRRLGFREMVNQQYYLCNHPNIGGANPTPYAATSDYYKYSYTVSNITSCDETPPAGA